MNHQLTISNALNSWIDEEAKSSRIITFLVEYLTDDEYWTKTNISKESISKLKNLISTIEHPSLIKIQ